LKPNQYWETPYEVLKRIGRVQCAKSCIGGGLTLKELQIEGLIKRESFAEIPPRVEYLLTTDGAELRKAIIPLLKMGINKKFQGQSQMRLGTQGNSRPSSEELNVIKQNLNETRSISNGTIVTHLSKNSQNKPKSA
jgi:hypothetical protein